VIIHYAITIYKTFMIKITCDAEYFNVKDTLYCGQIFRFKPYKDGYLVHSLDKCAYCYNDGDSAVIECEETDLAHFYEFFDLDKDYQKIVADAKSQGLKILSCAAEYCKGVRILRQNPLETLFSFIVSQNNNIPRIKGIIERLCARLGELKAFMEESFYAFPTAKKMAEMDEEFYKELGLGYRAEYIRRLAVEVVNGLDINEFSSLPTTELKKRLLSIHGVGPKVADCVTLFGFSRSDSFPVDTWIEKVYREDFSGNLKDRNKITEYFNERFKENAGYFQQYLFHYKRLIENNDK